MIAFRRLAPLALIPLLACARSDNARSSSTPETSDEAEVATDTLRGTIAVVGADPTTMVALRCRTGGGEVYLSGSDESMLGRLSGVDVWVSGQLDSAERRMEVRRFEVRSVDGVPAVDGVLEMGEQGLVLIRPDGRHLPIRNAPDELLQHIGARVWISGPLDEEPVAFGVIGPRS